LSQCLERAHLRLAAAGRKLRRLLIVPRQPDFFWGNAKTLAASLLPSTTLQPALGLLYDIHTESTGFCPTCPLPNQEPAQSKSRNRPLDFSDVFPQPPPESLGMASYGAQSCQGLSQRPQEADPRAYTGLSVLPSLADSSPNMDRLALGARNGNPPSPLYGDENPLGSYFAMPTAAMYSPAGGSGTRRESNASSSSSESTSDDDSSSSSASRPFSPHVTRAALHGSKSSTHGHVASRVAGSSSASSSSLALAVSARSPSALAASVSTAPIVAEDNDDDDDAAPIQPLPMHLPRPKTKQDRDRERAAGRGPSNAGVKREGLGTRLARKRADSLKWAKYANVATFQVELGLSNDELRSG
jgi:hypothetical protein